MSELTSQSPKNNYLCALIAMIYEKSKKRTNFGLL